MASLKPAHEVHGPHAMNPANAESHKRICMRRRFTSVGDSTVFKMLKVQVFDSNIPETGAHLQTLRRTQHVERFLTDSFNVYLRGTIWPPLQMHPDCWCR